MPTLQTVANGFSALLQTLDGVHSTRVRLKDPDHLLEKIVRKRADKRDITIRNYRTEITDLIGARALHLFKTDWPEIHWKIVDTWGAKTKRQWPRFGSVMTFRFIKPTTSSKKFIPQVTVRCITD